MMSPRSRALSARARTARCKCIFDRSSCLEIIHRISLYEFQNVETAGQPLQPGASPILFWPERSQNFARKASKHQAVAAPAMPATRARRRPSGRRRGGKPPQRRKANPPQRRLVAQRQWIPPAPVCRVQLDWCPTCQMPLWRSHSACCKLHSEEEEQAAATAAAAATLADEKQAAATAAAAAASKLAEEEQAVASRCTAHKQATVSQLARVQPMRHKQHVHRLQLSTAGGQGIHLC